MTPPTQHALSDEALEKMVQAAIEDLIDGNYPAALCAAWSASPGPGMGEALEDAKRIGQRLRNRDISAKKAGEILAALQPVEGGGVDLGSRKPFDPAELFEDNPPPISAAFLLEHVKVRLEARAEVMGERGVTMSPGLTMVVLDAVNAALAALSSSASLDLREWRAVPPEIPDATMRQLWRWLNARTSGWDHQAIRWLYRALLKELPAPPSDVALGGGEDG